MKMAGRYFGLALMVLLTFTLFACSGGGSSGSGSGSTTITGVAAAGAPVVGIVNVKGANGATASANIESDGSYTLDVSALTAPYILYAEGTVNGQTIKIYSTGVTTGTINITTVTDFIVRNAVSGSADDAYASWNSSSVTQSSIDSAEAKVQEQLQPVLDALGVSTNVNLLTTSFNADHTGIDAVLDALSIEYDDAGEVATVTNNFTGSTFSDDVTTGADDSSASLPDSDTNGTIEAKSDEELIEAGFEALEALYATSIPSNTALTNWFNTYVASDFLDDGQTRSQTIDSWASGDGPPVGIDISMTLVGQFDVTGTSYTKGYLFRFSYSVAGDTGSFLTYMVFDGTNWFWYGNREWLQADFKPEAIMSSSQGGETYGSGFLLWFDDGANYAYNNGVRSIVVTGPGLSVVLENQFPKTTYKIYGSTEWWEHQMLDDGVIAAIPDNSEYTVRLCSQDASTLAVSPDPASACTVLYSHVEMIGAAPLLNSELRSSHFPTLTEPSTHNMADLNYGGEITVSWTNPSNMSVRNVGLGWTASGTDYYLESDINNAATSVALDSTGLPAPTTVAPWLWLSGDDSYGRKFSLNWQFQ